MDLLCLLCLIEKMGKKMTGKAKKRIGIIGFGILFGLSYLIGIYLPTIRLAMTENPVTKVLENSFDKGTTEVKLEVALDKLVKQVGGGEKLGKKGLDLTGVVTIYQNQTADPKQQLELDYQWGIQSEFLGGRIPQLRGHTENGKAYISGIVLGGQTYFLNIPNLAAKWAECKEIVKEWENSNPKITDQAKATENKVKFRFGGLQYYTNLEGEKDHANCYQVDLPVGAEIKALIMAVNLGQDKLPLPVDKVQLKIFVGTELQIKHIEMYWAGERVLMADRNRVEQERCKIEVQSAQPWNEQNIWQSIGF